MNDRCKKIRRDKRVLFLSQIGVFIGVILLWEFGAKVGLLDEFLFSSPSSIFKLLVRYIETNEIWRHLFISILETIMGIIFGTFIGIVIAIILWASKFLSKLLEPFRSEERRVGKECRSRLG